MHLIHLEMKDGLTWTSNTSPSAMPVAYAWEKVFVDLSKVSINKSAIIEIRIGSDSSGIYYFDDVYFAQSYADLLPEEDLEDIKNDMGEKGQITDWDFEPENSDDSGKSNNSNLQKKNHIILAILAIISIILTIVLIRKELVKHKY